MTTVRACELIGHEGIFKLPGGRATYSDVLYNTSNRGGERPRLARLEPRSQVLASGYVEQYLHQVDRYVDWDQPVEVIRDYTTEYEAEREAELAGYDDEGRLDSSKETC